MLQVLTFLTDPSFYRKVSIENFQFESDLKICTLISLYITVSHSLDCCWKTSRFLDVTFCNIIVGAYGHFLFTILKRISELRQFSHQWHNKHNLKFLEHHYFVIKQHGDQVAYQILHFYTHCYVFLLLMLAWMKFY